MKNQCQHTGQNAAFKLLFSRIPIREILKKPSILEEGFEKSNCPNLGKNHEKSMSTHWAKRCFQVAFFTYPYTWILAKNEFWKKDLDFSGESEAKQKAKNRIAEIQEAFGES